MALAASYLLRLVAAALPIGLGVELLASLGNQDGRSSGDSDQQQGNIAGHVISFSISSCVLVMAGEIIATLVWHRLLAMTSACHSALLVEDPAVADTGDRGL